MKSKITLTLIISALMVLGSLASAAIGLAEFSRQDRLLGAFWFLTSFTWAVATYSFYGIRKKGRRWLEYFPTLVRLQALLIINCCLGAALHGARGHWMAAGIWLVQGLMLIALAGWNHRMKSRPG